MKKMLFILNPMAGKRKANKLLAQILSVFNRADYQVSVHITGFSGDATQVTQLLAPQMDLVVCCGGDGTFNEVLSGLLQSGADTPMGYIPAGSTNDFASSLHLPTKPLEAAKAIVEGTPREFDVGQFGDRYFSYVASFGAFTRTSYATSQSVKNALGHTAYILGGISELSQIHKIPVRLELDGEVIEDDFIFGAVSNSTSVGGVLTLDPSLVDMSDGKFELLLVRAPKSLGELSECLKALRTQKYNCNMITFRSASQVHIQTQAPLTWTLDGERADWDTEVAVTNLQKAFRLVVKG